MIKKRVVFFISAMLGLFIISYASHHVFAETANGQQSAAESQNVFLVDKKNAKTYVNPLCLPNIPVVMSPDKGKIPDDPFALSKMILKGLPETHKRFEALFGGLIPYICIQTAYRV